MRELALTIPILPGVVTKYFLQQATLETLGTQEKHSFLPVQAEMLEILQEIQLPIIPIPLLP